MMQKIIKNYDKIRHLVEVDDDILAVFIVVSSQMKELYVAKNSNIDKKTMLFYNSPSFRSIHESSQR
ncbi:MAG: hypothetical protein P0116_12485 [Candidatus Nitrosocosmicus sp.]|nr:hypothetical protein [Candidatus Nitrosocosmicus sp.]